MAGLQTLSLAIGVRIPVLPAELRLETRSALRRFRSQKATLASHVDQNLNQVLANLHALYDLNTLL